MARQSFYTYIRKTSTSMPPQAPPLFTPGYAGAFPWAERIPALERYGALTGRILLAQIFILSGALKFINWDATATMMEKQGMVWVPYYLAAAALVELVCGFSILLGYKSRLGALGLFLYLIPVTLIFHAFWDYTGEMHQMQMFNFTKNIAVMGGLWLIITFGSGMCSLDGWQRKWADREA